MKLLSPQELYQATIRDYMRNAGRAGMPARLSDIERLAKADLEMVDKHNAGLLPAAPKKPTAKRVDPMDQALAALPKAKKIARPAANKKKRQPKLPWWWPHAVARIGRILEMVTSETNLAAATSETAIPDLALEVARNEAAWQLRRPWAETTARRPYDGMSDYDAARKRIRFVEDACERSKKHPGLREWRFR